MEGQERLVQAYGLREAMTGVAILMSHDPEPWISGRIIGDTMDLVTLATNVPENGPERANRALAAVAVGGVTVLDIVCAQGLSSDKHLAGSGDFDYRYRSGFPRPPARMRGVAADFEVPADYRVPELLRPWTVT